MASITPVCAKCTEELLTKSNGRGASCDCGGDCEECEGDCTKECSCKKKKKKTADIYQQPGQPASEDLAQLSTKPVNENLPYACSICGRQGTQQEILDHVNRDHQDVLERQQEDYLNKPGLTTPSPALVSASIEKEAAPSDLEEQAIVEPLAQAPGDQFDDIVQDLANRAAAIQFSTLEDKDMNALADSLGLSAQDLEGKVQVVAVFDNYVGVNGQLSDGVPEAPEGYQEVQSQSVRATAHEALIPTQIVINKVAEQMNMPEDLAYNMVKDKYGDDLPDKYHAAVQGEYHFYVPASLATNSTDVAQEQGDIGPTPAAPDGGQLDQQYEEESRQF